MKKTFFLLLLAAVTINCFAQNKFEQEIRIKRRDVPESALYFIDSMQFNTKIKWYKEIGYNKISFEAKTKYKGKRYSVEFSEDGIFEDVEIVINFIDIPELARENIADYFSVEHSTHSIDKVQIQYSGSSSKVLEFFKNKELAKDIIIRYEFEISTKVDGSFARFEYLFSENGEFIKRSKILLNNADNIIY